MAQSKRKLAQKKGGRFRRSMTVLAPDNEYFQ